MRRVTSLLLVLATLGGVGGCGNDTTQKRDASVGATTSPVTGPYLYNLPGALRTLQRRGLEVRPSGGPDLASKSLPAPDTSAVYTADGTPFTLLVFSSEDVANDATNSLEGSAPGDVVIGKNVLGIVRAKGKAVERIRAAIGGLGDNPPGPEPATPAPGEPDS